jgi:membrane dipeptidase
VLCGESVNDVATSMRYVADRIGAEHLALGSDFDGGVTTVFDSTGLPLLTDALLAAGFSEDEVRQMMGGNYTRLLLHSLPARTP